MMLPSVIPHKAWWAAPRLEYATSRLVLVLEAVANTRVVGTAGQSFHANKDLIKVSLTLTLMIQTVSMKKTSPSYQHSPMLVSVSRTPLTLDANKSGNG